MKKFIDLSSRSQHKRVDSLLKKHRILSVEKIQVIAGRIDNSVLSDIDADTWSYLRPLWVKRGWILP